MSATWVSAGDKLLRCTAHQKVKPWRRDAPGGCSSCAAAGAPKKAPVVAVETPDETPKDCRSLEQHEQWFTDRALAIANKADEVLAAHKDSKSINAAVGLYDVALKAMRTAVELAHTRVRSRRVRRLEERARELSDQRQRAKRGAAN